MNHKPELRTTTSPIALGRTGYRDEVKRMLGSKTMESVVSKMAEANGQ